MVHYNCNELQPKEMKHLLFSSGHEGKHRKIIKLKRFSWFLSWEDWIDSSLKCKRTFVKGPC